MQNKNSVLTRGGFAVIAAVFMMLLITLMLLKMISYSTDVSGRTTDNYLNEQAQLLAFNATEDAVYRISGIDPSTSNCIISFTDTYPSNTTAIFDISVQIKYVWQTGAIPTGGANCNTTFTTVNTAEQAGSALIDVYVTSHANLNLHEPIRVHRRTLQKL